MTKKKLLIGIFTIVLLLFASSVPADELTPEQFLAKFYAWYFETDAREVADLNDSIYEFVSPETVTYMQNRTNRTEYYVTRAQSWSAAWKNPEIEIGSAIALYGGIFFVPVTFKITYRDWHVVVYVKKEGDEFKVIKVSDIFPY